MHDAAYSYVAWAVRQFHLKNKPVLEIGSRNINGTVRTLFTGRFCGIDLHPGRDVDVVCSGVTFVPDFVPDVIVCCEVLEHCDEAEGLCLHAFDLLPVGGMFIITAAATDRKPHSGIDGGELRPSEYYENVSEDMLLGWLKKFRILTYEIEDGDIRAVVIKEAANG